MFERNLSIGLWTTYYIIEAANHVRIKMSNNKDYQGTNGCSI